MKKASLVVSKAYLANAIFDRSNKSLNRDDCLASFYFLKEEFKKYNIDLSTQDINPINKSDIVIYNDMPKMLPKNNKVDSSYLLILESPLIVKNSWYPANLSKFKKIFTWNDEYIDGKKYIKINYTYDFEHQGFMQKEKKNLVCMITANKTSNEENELYSEREKVIRFFEENHSREFDLYGIGWDKARLSGLFRAIKKLPRLWRMIPFRKYPSYKGSVENKKAVMGQYQFSICYENVFGLNGYITEKIFDCFFSGTVPIYWGAENISKYIPKDCFIDRREFKNNEDLYYYIKNMSDEDYNIKIDKIKNFLFEQKWGEFSCKRYAEIICEEIVGQK